MATTAAKPASEISLRGARAEAPDEAAGTQPVVYWAIAGGIMLAFIAYMVIRWITGPYFKSVPGGPTQVPTGQHIALQVIQWGGTAIAVGCIVWFLVRPWVRNGQPTTEGLLSVCYGLLYIQDPVSVGGGYWFTYNATMWNRGSWVAYMPLFNNPDGRPGHMLAEPVFGMGSGYVYFWILLVAASLWAFRTVKTRFPRLGTPGAVFAAYLVPALGDVVLEGFVWMKTGFYAYPGAPGPHLFPGHASAYPILEGILIGCLIFPYALLRYYKDDKGYTFVERGIDKVRVGKNTKVLLRFLALLAVAQGIYFFSYNIWAYQIGVHQQTWPKAVQQRSYFLNGVCGAGTNKLCPGPAVPNIRPHSGYFTPAGTVGLPAGTHLPKAYPVLTGKH
jgi:Spirocyclase AveC-like